MVLVALMVAVLVGLLLSLGAAVLLVQETYCRCPNWPGAVAALALLIISAAGFFVAPYQLPHRLPWLPALVEGAPTQGFYWLAASPHCEDCPPAVDGRPVVLYAPPGQEQYEDVATRASVSKQRYPSCSFDAGAVTPTGQIESIHLTRLSTNVVELQLGLDLFGGGTYRYFCGQRGPVLLQTNLWGDGAYGHLTALVIWLGWLGLNLAIVLTLRRRRVAAWMNVGNTKPTAKIGDRLTPPFESNSALG